MQRVIVGSDHGGFDLAKYCIDVLLSKGIEVENAGCFSKDSCDYPDFGEKAAVQVANKKFNYGILICTTGIGMSITANKVKGVRAALCYNHEAAVLTRAHNNANVLVMGSKFVDEDEALKILEVFFGTEFEAGRHLRRVNKITEIELKN